VTTTAPVGPPPTAGDPEDEVLDAAARRRRAWREVRAVAGLEALDGLRSRRQLVVRAVTPIILFVCVLGVTIALRGVDQRNHPQAYRIAVEGDYDGARGTLALLNPGRLEFFPVPDSRLATIDGADAGLHVPDHLDQTLAEQHDAVVPLELHEVTSNPSSRAGVVLVQSAFVDLHTSSVQTRVDDALRARGTVPGAAATGPTRVGRFEPLTINVEVTSAGTRTLTSQVIPGLLCLQAALLVAGTANRLVSRRSRGLLTAQLLLPISRRSLAIAKGLGELAVGFVTASPVMIALLGFGAIIALRDGSPAQAVIQLVATVLAMLTLFGFTTMVGVVIGTAARTQEQVSLATGGAVIVAALVATIVALGPVTPPPALAVVPFAGAIGMLREVLNGTGSFGALVVGALTTVLGSYIISLFGGRSLNGERLVLRNG